jgi:hypothetical protein
MGISKFSQNSLNSSQQSKSANYVLNSSFDIIQRGTAAIEFASRRYTADQWAVARTSNAVGGLFSISDNRPLMFNRSVVIRRESEIATTNTILLTQNFETAGKELNGKTVTLSFYANRGSDYSAVNNELNFGISTSSASPDSVSYASNGVFLSSSPDRVILKETVNLTTSWNRHSATFIVPTTAEAFQIYFEYVPVGTAGSSDFYRITGVQLEEGPVATPFKRNAPSIAAELAACQRYYQLFKTSSAVFQLGFAFSTTQAIIPYRPLIEMRAAPSVSFDTATKFGLSSPTGGRIACTAIIADPIQKDLIRIIATVASGLTAGNATALQNSGQGVTYFFELAAEL